MKNESYKKDFNKSLKNILMIVLNGRSYGFVEEKGNITASFISAGEYIELGSFKSKAEAVAACALEANKRWHYSIKVKT